ncbi:MAG: HPF/RaiA family ribosome-associated protein [Gammaproteobacteria bacterium]|jgi:ribosomal subunit interface protein
MRIDIQALNFSLTDAMRVHIERRLSYALSTRHKHIVRIWVRLCDINGPRGGNDMRCQIQVILPGQPAVIVEDTESNLYVAIDRAIDRANRTVSRRLSRRRNKTVRILPDNSSASGMEPDYLY